MTDDANLLTDRTRRLALEAIRERGQPISLEEFRRMNLVQPTWAAPILRHMVTRGDLVMVHGDRYALAPQHDSHDPVSVPSRAEQRAAADELRKRTDGGVRVVNVIDPAHVSAAIKSAAGEKTIVNVIASAGTKAPRAAPVLVEGRKACRKCHVPREAQYFIRAQSMRPDARVTVCGFCLGILTADQVLEPVELKGPGLEAPDKQLLPRERAALTMRRWKDRTGHSLTITIQWRDDDRLARLEQRLLARAAAQPTEVRHYTHLLASVALRAGAFANTLADGVEDGSLTLALFESLRDDERIVP